jgi:hypothetical protein
LYYLLHVLTISPLQIPGVYLSGGSAYRWYFNPTIPEAEPYHTRYKNCVQKL